MVVVSVLDGGWLSFVGWVDMGLSGGQWLWVVER